MVPLWNIIFCASQLTWTEWEMFRKYLCIKRIWTFLAKAQMVRIKVHFQGPVVSYEHREADKWFKNGFTVEYEKFWRNWKSIIILQGDSLISSKMGDIHFLRCKGERLALVLWRRKKPSTYVKWTYNTSWMTHTKIKGYNIFRV